MCEKSNNNREEWAKELENKIRKLEQHKNAEEEEKMTVQEMLFDMSKHFNNDKNLCTNQQLIGKKLFR